MSHLGVYRMTDGGIELVGRLSRENGSFAYCPDYLASTAPAPISYSLPLRAEEYDGASARPYFEGLIPEGLARSAVAALLHVRSEDYLSLLAGYGFECVGDVIIADKEERLDFAYEPIEIGSLAKDLAHGEATARINEVSRLSLAGTQNKVGLFHNPDEADLRIGWGKPIGGAPSTHILKSSERRNVLYLEYLCTRAAQICGVPAARVHLLDLGGPVLCSERFDRAWVGEGKDGSKPRLVRLHQEDFAQAFGLLPTSKYAELEGGTAQTVASLIRRSFDRPIANLEAFALLSLFNYLIGNCDNHLKNLSILYGADWRERKLAPAYDLVCTTWFPDISREMGMLLGGEGAIDAVGPEHLVAFAREIGLPPARFSKMCASLAGQVDTAIDQAAADGATGLDEIAWKAGELHEDIAARKLVLERAAAQVP